MRVRWVFAAVAAAVLSAGAEAGAGDIAAFPASLHCGSRTLGACTEERVEALRRLSAALKQAALQKPPAPLASASDREALARYDAWLTQQSERAAQLANIGQRALEAAPKDRTDPQVSFNLRYLELQSQMQNENRSYTAVSNIMKTKHDTVKNSISNIR